MITIEQIRWGVAGLFWIVALFILYFNISRHFKNNNNSERRISGTPFLFTIFFSLGAAASPLDMFWIFLPGIIFEIPAIGDFRFKD